MSDETRLSVFGLEVHASPLECSVKWVHDRGSLKEPSLVVTPNVDHFVRWQKHIEFRDVYERAHLRTLDGKPLVWLTRLLYPGVKPARVTGVDLLDAILDCPDFDGWTVSIIGGRPEANAAARATVKERGRHLRIGVFASPSREDLSNNAYLQDLAQSLDQFGDRHVVAVCLGSPLQEQVAVRLADAGTSAGRVFLCVGAAVDFLAGTVARAPKWMGAAGIEWMYRLVKEPGRLWRRYLIEDSVFAKYLLVAAYRRVLGR